MDRRQIGSLSKKNLFSIKDKPFSESFFFNRSKLCRILVISFFRTILIVRYLNTEYYGAYQYLFSLTAVISIFYQNLDTGISRFLPTIEKGKKTPLIFGTIILKLLIFALVVSILFFWKSSVAQKVSLLNDTYLFILYLFAILFLLISSKIAFLQF